METAKIAENESLQTSKQRRERVRECLSSEKRMLNLCDVYIKIDTLQLKAVCMFAKQN
jgi:hypothetical protein